MMRLARDKLEALCALALDAGREIMDVYGHETIVAVTKEDTSPLTQADLRSDAVIRRGLQASFPGVFIQSEEAVSADPGGTRTFFLVDPLDGTKEFLKRNGEFTVNIALIDEGEAVAGVVYAPALGELYFAARGLGAWKKDGEGKGEDAVPLVTQPCDPEQPLRVIGSRSHGGDALTEWLTRLKRPHEFVAAGSSLKFCRIAEGAADIYPRHGPTSQWDTAAAQAVLEEAGGLVLDPQGQPLRYGLGLPVLNPFFVAVGDPALEFPSMH